MELQIIFISQTYFEIDKNWFFKNIIFNWHYTIIFIVAQCIVDSLNLLHNNECTVIL